MSTGNPDGVAGGLVKADEPMNPTPYRRDEILDQLPEGGGFQGVILDANDPVEAAMADLIRLYRYRRPGMAIDGDVFATFERSARALDIPAFGIPEALLHLIQKEQSSINAMRRANTLFDPDNNEALSAYLEMAFHANILYAWIKGWTRR